jgi:hypothetical protein
MMYSSIWWRGVSWVSICLVALLGLALAVHAQEDIVVLAESHEHVFNESMTFRLNVSSTTEISTARLFYRVTGQTSAHTSELEFEPSTKVQLIYKEDMADESNYQPPMIGITYWWLIENAEGQRLKTEPVYFVYEDTRYDWQVLEGEHVRLYWHDQDQAFGQGFFKAAGAAAADLSSEFGVSPKDPVSIVIYNSHSELMSTLVESSAEWTGAVNFSGKGCIAIGLGSMAWMERVIPHELTHAMLDQVTQPPFGDIPRWLHEGLAMRSEGGMTIEERAALNAAIAENKLISLRALNSAFADAREQAILSYAESNSLINFIIDEYGADALGQLIDVFAVGAHYDDALIEVFGVDMDGMEDLWRDYIGAPPRVGETRATPVPTITATTEPVPSDTPTAETVVETPPTATVVAAVPTSTVTTQPSPTSLPPSPTPPPATQQGPPCLGAVPALAVLALFVAFRARSRL